MLTRDERVGGPVDLAQGHKHLHGPSGRASLLAVHNALFSSVSFMAGLPFYDPLRPRGDGVHLDEIGRRRMTSRGFWSQAVVTPGRLAHIAPPAR
jgi:hypothetical protein